MPSKIPSTRLPSHDIAKQLVDVKSKLLPLLTEEEALKVSIRTYGAHVYTVISEGNLLGTVTVGEPEVRTFKGRKLVLNTDAALRLPAEDLLHLERLGVLTWVDDYTRTAVAKVETKVLG